MGKLKRKQYEALLEPMEQELVSMARWVAETGRRVLVLFEGRDTAGKGGAINAIADRLNPRQCKVVALPKPSEDESCQWYFQRYVAHLPSAGQIALFASLAGAAQNGPAAVPPAPLAAQAGGVSLVPHMAVLEDSDFRLAVCCRAVQA